MKKFIAVLLCGAMTVGLAACGSATGTTSAAGTAFGAAKVPFLRNGFRMVIFSILLMIVVLFWNHGITGSKEITWDRFFAFVKKFKKDPVQEERA